MSKVIHRRWPGNPDAPSRRGRAACDYEAYVPDLLVGRNIALDGDVAADVTDAEAAINRLNAEASALADTEALARLLLRAESVASSRIEGLCLPLPKRRSRMLSSRRFTRSRTGTDGLAAD